ncbi:thioesterase [Marivirga lumbricoides]|uniref:Thioesterase n=1 Tax=Marivirga lumbricoides TaxID=1046115 RepID=A0A2T4DVJ1_9BACT|nr:thioesterase [Marivirga lumbricoides]GGC52715.1 thioesterase [Marivirga lumbricoides]
MEKGFIKEVIIQPSDFDQMGHVNNVVYLQWVQDVAEAHWKSISDEDLLKEFVWVALRHEIDYLKEIKPGETIIAETFVKSMEGVKSERHTVISSADSGQVKSKAITFWCLLDAKSKRPKRIPQDLKDLFIAL